MRMQRHAHATNSYRIVYQCTRSLTIINRLTIVTDSVRYARPTAGMKMLGEKGTSMIPRIRSSRSAFICLTLLILAITSLASGTVWGQTETAQQQSQDQADNMETPEHHDSVLHNPIACLDSTTPLCTLTRFNRPEGWICADPKHETNPPSKSGKANRRCTDAQTDEQVVDITYQPIYTYPYTSAVPAPIPATGPLPPPYTEGQQRIDYVSAILASKVIYSGTIIAATAVGLDQNECMRYEWRVVLLAEESSNTLIYGPADISEFCTGDGHILLIVPVKVRWAEISGHWAVPDVLHKPPSKPGPPPLYCDQIVPTTAAAPFYGIYPCDEFKENKSQGPTDEKRKFGKAAYSRFLAGPYDVMAQPNSTQGTLTYAPGLGKVPNGNLACGTPPVPGCVKPPSENISFDLQLYPSQRVGVGWIGFPLVFEKATVATSNLDSLTFALSYDFRLDTKRPKAFRFDFERGPAESATLRMPEFRMWYGPEIAPTTPHDLNTVAAGTVRFPLIFAIHYQPSALSIFPLAGIEGGNHVSTSIPESDDILRKVVGADASLRIPYIITHAFGGDKPVVIDASWRTRYLSYPEPFTDYVSGVSRMLRKGQINFWRGDFIVPISTYYQFKVTVQHGGLPPDFDYLGYSVSIGLTYNNPGYSEH
jgi:hypothetical protein